MAWTFLPFNDWIAATVPSGVPRSNLRAALGTRVAMLLARIGLSGAEQRLARELSHGQQQWLSIAMSMSLDPKILLLDEPTAGMSVEETDKTAEIIRQLNAEGVTIVVIEHDMAFIRNLDARTSVLHYGKLFAQGSFAEIAADADVRRIYLGVI
jgi:branched-chain amino acid transport system ATP-binding protein